MFKSKSKCNSVDKADGMDPTSSSDTNYVKMIRKLLTASYVASSDILSIMG